MALPVFLKVSRVGSEDIVYMDKKVIEKEWVIVNTLYEKNRPMGD